MKIELSKIDSEQFFVSPYVVAGETVFLVHPQHIGAKWDKNNLHLRSSVWNKDGELISASFKKFFNWAEQPDLVPTPKDLTSNGGVNLMEKLDGSTLVVSKYKGETIARTRGALYASKMDKCGYEIELLKQKYPLAFDISGEDSPDFSLIYEWVSPNNKIVLNYSEPDIYLIGMISHIDYSMVSQSELDVLAQDLGVKRPRKFKYNTFEEMFGAIHALDYAESRRIQSPKEILVDSRAKVVTELSTNFEGFCVYFHQDQHIRKVKSAWYLALHKLKSELASIDKVIDLWATLNYPEYQLFIKYIEDNFDFEIAQSCRGFTSRICEAKKEVDKIIAHMHEFIKPLKSKSRKDAALAIIGAFGNTNRSGFVFSILDSKSLDRDAIKKLIYQVMK